MNEASIIVLLFIGVAFFSAFLLKRKARPDQEFFICGRCSKKAPHSDRTVGAWRKGVTRFYCNACHSTWVGSRPGIQSRGGQPKGCLGVILLFATASVSAAWMILAP